MCSAVKLELIIEMKVESDENLEQANNRYDDTPDLEFEAEEIVGSMIRNGEVELDVRFKGSSRIITFPAKIAYLTWPELVIEYYKGAIVFD